ncbi:MAG TPA: hypothetical protein VK453_18355 [Micromonosporaceae bacterium]|nr:hypothetical protein [Micromonosporaceae bacterium]
MATTGTDQNTSRSRTAGFNVDTFWLITIAAVYALVVTERGLYTNVLLGVMIAAGTASSFLRARMARQGRDARIARRQATAGPAS